MKRIVAIVQARMGASRFPGKMLALLGDFPVLHWVLKRVSRAHSIDQVVLATSDHPRDDVLVGLAQHCGARIFRGSEGDVLGRFVGAAQHAEADIVVRVCADNPFIAPEEIDRLIQFYKENMCDYACNHQARLNSYYADGFGAEIFSTKLLEKIANVTNELPYREHVTLYVWEHMKDFSLRVVPPPTELAYPELRFDIDVPDDLTRLNYLVKNSSINIDSHAADITKSTLSVEIQSYLDRLFPLCRSVTGEPNRQTLRALQEITPITIREVRSGTAVYDWVVPDEWNIRDAWIASTDGRRIVDFRVNNLHVMSYSEPVNQRMKWDELKSHLHTHPTLAEAIPYRTSYYQRDWGFCVTHSQYVELEKLQGPFEVAIDSQIKPGFLTYGECLLPGRSAQEVLISCYICHPSMANDSLSGVLLTAFLTRHLASLKERHWSYRIVFVPETIGAITYCALNEDVMKKIDMGLVITTVGGPGKFGYKQSWQARHPINLLIEETFRDEGKDFITYPFDIHGSDERQYSSQGFRINCATVCKDRYYQYPEYHSSLDDLSLVSGAQIGETLHLYCRLIEKVEARQIYRSLIPHCEVMLSKHNLYPRLGGHQRPELGGRSEMDLILWLLFLCDGHKGLREIAQEIGVNEKRLHPIIKRLKVQGVLESV